MSGPTPAEIEADWIEPIVRRYFDMRSTESAVAFQLIGELKAALPDHAAATGNRTAANTHQTADQQKPAPEAVSAGGPSNTTTGSEPCDLGAIEARRGACGCEDHEAHDPDCAAGHDLECDSDCYSPQGCPRWLARQVYELRARVAELEAEVWTLTRSEDSRLVVAEAELEQWINANEAACKAIPTEPELTGLPLPEAIRQLARQRDTARRDGAADALHWVANAGWPDIDTPLSTSDRRTLHRLADRILSGELTIPTITEEQPS